MDNGFTTDVIAALERGYTAFICDSRRSAAQVRETIERRGIAIPGAVSLAAIGSGWGDYPCTGYFVHSEQKAQTIIQLLRKAQAKRPTTLWLTGVYVDAKTTGPLMPNLDAAAAAIASDEQWKSMSL